MKYFTQKFVDFLLLIPWVAACTAGPPPISTRQPTPIRTAASPATTPTLFRSAAYSLSVRLPPGWAAAEGPVSLARPFDGLVAFNSFGQAGFFAKQVVSEDGKTFTYSPQSVLEQIPADGAYIVLVHQSGGPALPPEDQGPEYGRADLSGLWAAHDCRTSEEQAGASPYDFLKEGRHLRLEVYCGEKASDETAQAVNELLASWRFGAANAASAAAPVPAEAPTSTPDTSAWIPYTHPVSGVSVRYPPGWKGDPFSTAYGSDGLLVLKDLGTFNVFTLEQICTSEAGPAAQGDERPPFERTQINGDEACLTRSFENPPYEVATLVVAHPAGDGALQFAGMTADLGHILTIAATLHWPQGESGAASPPPPSATPAIEQAYPSGLAVEAYRTGNGENLTSPDLLDAGFQPIPNGAEKKRQAYRQPGATEAGVNSALAAFGCRLDGGTLTCQGDTLGEGLRPLGAVSANRAGDDFVLGLLREEDYAKFLLDKDGLHEWKGTLPPVYLGDELLTLEMSPDWKVEVRRGGRAFYSGAAVPHPAGGVYGLHAWDEHWALETTGSVLVDGQEVNTTEGYEESFGLRLLGGRPFYLFQKNGRVNAWYDGEVIPLGFEQVVHYVCCSGAPLDLRGNEVMTWFYARKDGQWFYVEMGVYPVG